MDSSNTILEQISQCENIMIDSIMNKLKSEKSLEFIKKNDIKGWSEYQYSMLDVYKSEMSKKFKKILGKNAEYNDVILAFLIAAFINGCKKSVKKLKEAKRAGYKPGRAIKTFADFKENKKAMTLYNEVNDNIEKALKQGIKYSYNEYAKIIFNTEREFNENKKKDLSISIDNVSNEFFSKGVNCVQYKNGHMVGLSIYLMMLLKTCEKRAYMLGEADIRDKNNEPLVLVIYRDDACPFCMQYVGRVFIDDVFGNGKSDGEHELLSDAVAGGLYHPNCLDSHIPYFDGITKETPASQKEQLKAERIYKQKQYKKYVERNIAKYERLSNSSVNAENAERFNNLLRKWKNKQL